MWEFDEAVEVRSGVVDGIETPEQFLWRGRLWRVCAVEAHWVETAAWWERGVIGSGEAKISDAVADWFRELGGEVRGQGGARRQARDDRRQGSEGPFRVATRARRPGRGRDLWSGDRGA